MLVQPDGQVVEAGHDPGRGSGPDFAGVLPIGDVADMVQGLDAPVATDQHGNLGVGELARWEAGDGVDGDDRGFAGFVVFDLNSPSGVGKGQPWADCADLHAADLAAAVSSLVGTVVEHRLAPGEYLESAVQRRLVALDDEQVVAAASDDLPGVVLLGVQDVDGDHSVASDEITNGCDLPRADTLARLG